MKKIILLSFIIFLSINVNAQWRLEIPEKKQQEYKPIAKEKQTNTFDKTKITYGGSFGFGFSSNSTLINIAPQIGYNLTDKFNVGAGVSYSYYNYKYNGFDGRWKDINSYYGLNVYGRYYPIYNIILSVQPEINLLNRKTTSPSGQKFSDSKVVPSLIVGAGVRVGPIQVMLNYDVVQNDNSPYGTNLFYGVGFVF